MAKPETNPQSSTKIGVRSSSQKQDGTRHAFDTAPAARPKPGAYGKEDRARGEGADVSDASSRNGAAGRGKRAAIRKMKDARQRG